jgi:hypothetical protein
MDANMAGRPGPGCIVGGWPGSPSSRRSKIEAMLPDWTLAPVVAALQTMRGMALVNAATLIVELGDLSRFANQPGLALLPQQQLAAEPR